MQLNRIIALALLCLCFVAVVLGVQRPQQAQRDGAGLDLSALQKSSTTRLELLALEGQISSGSFGPNSALGIRDRLLKLADEAAVKGVLLTVNSPGGSVGASEELYQAVRKLREQKPVVVSMVDVAASGGYYAASAADQIYANPGTLVGSIGVILPGCYNLRELFDRVGVQPQPLKTGPYKDTCSPDRPITPQERTLLETLLNSTLDQFVKDVAAGRGSERLSETQVRSLADGRIFNGTQAKASGLIDQLGTLDDATRALRQLARKRFKLSDREALPLVKSRPDFQSLFGSLLSQGRLGAGSVGSLGQLLELLLRGQDSGQPVTQLPTWPGGLPQPMLLPMVLPEL